MERSARRFVAPGRVNLIGEHTDYNDGFALPAAIDRYCTCDIVPEAGDALKIWSHEFNEMVELAIDEPFAKTRTWRDYAAGVLAAVREIAAIPHGASITIESSVPLGGGLSSSAAFELALGQALCFLAGIPPEPHRLAQIGARAEREFVGIRSGVMDQLVSALGVAESALLLDCRTLLTTPIALPADVRIIIIDSLIKHGLVSSEYNARREACEEAVTTLQNHGWEIEQLRDVPVGRLPEAQTILDDLHFRRVRHVVTENQRVKDVVAALALGDLDAVGRAMRDSHESLRADYEVTTPELDDIASLARDIPGVVGARMTGGGFGGCVVALGSEESFAPLRDALEERYFAPRQLQTSVFLTKAVGGAHEILSAA